MSIRDELLAIKAQSTDGMLHCEKAIAWAKAHPRSDLHGALEWDDGKCGVQWRLQQMRQLIQLHVTSDDGTPQLISLSIDRVNGGGYRAISDVARNRRLSEIAERDAMRELIHARGKYGHIRRFSRIWQSIDRASQEFEEFEEA
jgi:hypothetical protein